MAHYSLLSGRVSFHLRVLLKFYAGDNLINRVNLANMVFLSSFFFFFKIMFICLRETEHEQGGVDGAVDSPLSREPDVGLDPRTLRSYTS